jgi:hypothetical protein
MQKKEIKKIGFFFVFFATSVAIADSRYFKILSASSAVSLFEVI